MVMPSRAPAARKERLTSIGRKGALLNANGYLLEPGASIYLPVRVIPPPRAKKGDTVDVSVHGGLLPLVAGARTAGGNGFTYHVVVP